MPAPGRRFPFRYPEALKRRVDVVTAMAWEALVDAYAHHALEFVEFLGNHIPFDQAAVRFIREMDIPPDIAAAVQTRVLAALDAHVGEGRLDPAAVPDAAVPDAAVPDAGSTAAGSTAPFEGWRRLRPDLVFRGVRRRQRRQGELERIVELALARAEEGVIRVHVDNAVRLAELLERHYPLRRGIEDYIDAFGLAGGRAQSVFQRGMARLADFRLAGLEPGATPRRDRP